MKITPFLVAFSVAGLLMTGCSRQQPTDEQSDTSESTTTTENIEVTQYLPALENPPSAKKVPYEFSHHGITVQDDWFWLRDPNYPDTQDEEVLGYLNTENDYYQKWLAPYSDFKTKLFEELKGRMDETETSVPVISNGYEYKWEFLDGKEYRTYLRRPAGTDAE